MRCAEPAAGGRTVLPSGALAALLCALTALPVHGGGSPDEHRHDIHLRRYAMGATFEVFVYHRSAEDARTAARAALAEVERLDRVMSHFDRTSELSRLAQNAWREEVAVSPDLYSAIATALRIARLSDGAFDITVGPLVRTLREARDSGRSATAGEIAAARDCVGANRIELRPPDRIRLHARCVELDLGGIGKGYAVDRAIAVLAASGVRHALVNAGRSSIRAIGHPPGNDGWPVLIDGRGAAGRELVLRNSALATSEAGGSSDIVHPRTGLPAAAGSVTVAAPSATIADAASTALLLMSAADGKRLLRALRARMVVSSSES